MEKQVRIGIGVMIKKGNKILLGHRVSKPVDTGGILEPDSWCLPGGKQEYEETILEASKVRFSPSRLMTSESGPISII